MTREEAIKTIKENCCAMCAYGSQDMDSCDIHSCDNKDAIKALEQEPTRMIDKSNFSQEQYKADLQCAYDCGKSILDKIRAEIVESRSRQNVGVLEYI